MTERNSTAVIPPETVDVPAAHAEAAEGGEYWHESHHDMEVRYQTDIEANLDPVSQTWQNPSPEDKIRLTTRTMADQPARHFGGQPESGARVNGVHERFAAGHEQRDRAEEAWASAEEDRLAETGIRGRLRALRRRGH